ncbi:hypothetical protein AB0P17_16975 [Streptomyces sp. NPDC088124]|uniref:hypothetical protein n=1 Tax=Streptomyces sp. NPDC088124 TaxID=3154654 RepID=UPI003417AC13
MDAGLVPSPVPARGPRRRRPPQLLNHPDGSFAALGSRSANTRVLRATAALALLSALAQGLLAGLIVTGDVGLLTVHNVLGSVISLFALVQFALALALVERRGRGQRRSRCSCCSSSSPRAAPAPSWQTVLTREAL